MAGKSRRNAATTQWTKAKAAAKSLYRKIRRWKGVISVGYGTKEVDQKFVKSGSKKDAVCLVVFVHKKPVSDKKSAESRATQFKRAHPQRKLIPEKWEGFETDVREAPEATFAADPTGGDEVEAQGTGETGTVGIFVESTRSGQTDTFGLSNAHVLCKPIEDTSNRKVTDKTNNVVLGNTILNGYARKRHDCASVKLDAGVTVELLKVGGVKVTFNSDDSEVTEQASVKSCGAVTKNMDGKVMVLDVTVKVNGKWFKECIELEGTSLPSFGVSGDSGSLVYEASTKRSVGLFFAYSDEKTRGYAVTLKNVCNALKLNL